MLPHARRVSTKLFTDILRHSSTFSSPNLLLRVTFVAPDLESRFSVTVPKKVDVRAVYRNRARRRVYSVLRKHLSSLPHGLYGILHAKKGVLTASFRDLEQEVVGLITKTKRISR